MSFEIRSLLDNCKVPLGDHFLAKLLFRLLGNLGYCLGNLSIFPGLDCSPFAGRYIRLSIICLVGAFSFQGKMQDSYCYLFFLQTTDLTLMGPLFRETPETTKAKSDESKRSAKGPRFIFFTFLT